LSTRIQQLNPRQFLCPSKILGFQNFGVSGFGVFGPRRFSPSLPSSTPDSRTSNLSSPGPTAQLSPTPVARGTFRRVHVTFGDVIGSHHSRLSSRLTGTWCTPMCPRPFQGNPMVRLLSDLRRRSFRRFGVSASGVRASPHLELSFAEILKLLSTLPLDPTVKFLSYDLRCRSFQNFGFRYFATCENKVLPLWFPRVPKCHPAATCPPDGWSRRIQDFAYRDFHVPVQLERVFKPCARFPDLTVTRVLLFPEQILRLQHFWCGVLSPCGQMPPRLRFHNTATPPELGNMVK
jgi:hypothetical protein